MKSLLQQSQRHGRKAQENVQLKYLLEKRYLGSALMRQSKVSLTKANIVWIPPTSTVFFQVPQLEKKMSAQFCLRETVREEVDTPTKGRVFTEKPPYIKRQGEGTDTGMGNCLIRKLNLQSDFIFRRHRGRGKLMHKV